MSSHVLRRTPCFKHSSSFHLASVGESRASSSNFNDDSSTTLVRRSATKLKLNTPPEYLGMYSVEHTCISASAAARNQTASWPCQSNQHPSSQIPTLQFPATYRHRRHVSSVMAYRDATRAARPDWPCPSRKPEPRNQRKPHDNIAVLL